MCYNSICAKLNDWQPEKRTSIYPYPFQWIYFVLVMSLRNTIDDGNILGYNSFKTTFLRSIKINNKKDSAFINTM